MANFTATQGRYLAFIHAYTNLYGYPPAESEIAAAMCVSPPSVNQMVKMLEKKGLILRVPCEPRSIQLLVPEDEIPAWGKQGKSPSRTSNRSNRTQAPSHSDRVGPVKNMAWATSKTLMVMGTMTSCTTSRLRVRVFSAGTQQQL